MDGSKMADYIKENTNPQYTHNRSSGWGRTQGRSMTIPAPKPRVNPHPNPFQSEPNPNPNSEPQMIVASTFIGHAKLVMTCADDVRAMSSKSTCHQWYDTLLYLALSLCVVISHVVWCILRWCKDKYKEWLHYIHLLNHTRNTLYQS